MTVEPKRGASLLVRTGVAAATLGVRPERLRRWWRRGLVTPQRLTPLGGHARWDVDALRRQTANAGLLAAEAPAEVDE